MKLYPVKYKEKAWHVIITWSRPRRIANYLSDPRDEEASLYMVIHKNKKRILYLGMTHRQYTNDRIRAHGYKNVFVSTGIMEVVESVVTEQRVKDTESLLIYTYQPRDNIMKKKWIAPKEETLVENKGFCSFFPQRIKRGQTLFKGDSALLFNFLTRRGKKAKIYLWQEWLFLNFLTI